MDRRPRDVLPDPVDGADGVQARARRLHGHAEAVLLPYAGAVQGRLRGRRRHRAAELGVGDDRIDDPRAAAGAPVRVRARDPAGGEVARRAVLLPLHPHAAGGRRDRPDLRDRARRRDARQHLDAGRPLHGDEPADRGLDAALVHERGAGRGARGRPRRRLTSVRAQTVPVYLVGFITSEGAFWARLSAAATLAAIPVLLAGWIAQRQLVRGLTLGAIK
jgi:hypothetical protein